MIEATVRDYLAQKLNNVPVYLDIPADPPARFVSLEKTGSSRTNQVDTATFAIQSWDGRKYSASVLNQRVKEAMYDIVELDAIGAVRLSSDYDWTDTEKKHYRYQAVFSLTYYEEATNG